MIRWNFVFTRLVIVTLILVLIRWGLGPVAGYVTVRSIELGTGARVEIADTKVGLFPPRVQFFDVRIADPRSDKEMKDAFRADCIDLVIDGDALLHRRFVVSDGRVTGVLLGADRDTTGHFEDVEIEAAESGPSMLDGLLGDVGGKAENAAKDFAENLETIKRGNQIREAWETDYAAMLAKAQGLEKQIRDIRDKSRDLMKSNDLYNKLRDTSELPALLEQAIRVREELVQVRQQIDSMPGRVQSDMIAMQQAKQIDMQKIDAYVPGDLSQSKNFGVDLVTTAIRGEIQRVRDYLDGGRALADYTVVAPDAQRTRGIDFDLSGDRRYPDALIRRCEVNGVMRASGNAYTMTGVLENLTPTPELLVEPTKAKFQLDGPDVVNVEIVRDRRGGSDIDLLTVHWPDMQPEPMKFGKQDDVRLSIQGGSRELWVKLRNENGVLNGRLVSKQLGVRVGLDVNDKAAGTAMVQSLQNSLAAVDRIEIDSKFNGTWEDLDFDVNSNIGQMLSRATRDAMADQVAASKQQLAAKVNAEHLKQTQVLNEWLASHQGKTNDLMRSADESIAEITNKIAEKTDRFAGNLWNEIEKKLR